MHARDCLCHPNLASAAISNANRNRTLRNNRSSLARWMWTVHAKVCRHYAVQRRSTSVAKLGRQIARALPSLGGWKLARNHPTKMLEVGVSPPAIDSQMHLPAFDLRLVAHPMPAGCGSPPPATRVGHSGREPAWRRQRLRLPTLAYDCPKHSLSDWSRMPVGELNSAVAALSAPLLSSIKKGSQPGYS